MSILLIFAEEVENRLLLRFNHTIFFYKDTTSITPFVKTANY